MGTVKLSDLRQDEKTVLWVSLLVHIWCAWFSAGFHHGDEHAQILEFANYKLGFSPAEKLPWEFAAQIRPALQPFIAFLVGKMMLLIGIYNPFTLAFLLRFITAIASWYAGVLSIEYVKPFLTKDKQLLSFILFSNFLWFIPYIHVRFSSEVLSGLFFFFALHQLLGVVESDSREHVSLKSIFIGVLLSLSFWCRFQIGFAIIGLALWLAVFKRSYIKFFLVSLLASSVISIGAILLDHWLYGNWVFTPYRYFEVNIVKDVAAQWGTSPWWDCFLQFALQAGLPISLILLLMVGLSIATNPKSPFVWILITFLLGHMAIAHKELRFLFPMIFIYPICTFLFFKNTKAANWLKLLSTKWIQLTGKIMITANFVLLLVLLFIKPASVELSMHKYIYERTEAKPVKLVTLKSTYFEDLPFYNPLNFEFKRVSSLKEVSGLINQGNTVFFLDDHFELPDSIAHHPDLKLELRYRTIPAFAKKLNFNGWVERTKVGCLYKPTLTAK